MKTWIDRGFRPEIAPYLSERSLGILNRWGVRTAGTPIEGVEDYRTALWHGSRYNHNDETVSFVMALPDNQRFPRDISQASFFFGMAARQMVEIAPVQTDVFADAAANTWSPNGWGSSGVYESDDRRSVFANLVNVLVAYAPLPGHHNPGLTE